ncbi:MAG: glucose-1-phosphate adenylyltransferase [Omnitrophica WOR_2 bacterium RIFCSPHIGHO2_01_FULL_48_9]|nr:MAG: glucose-1-phosphate adenylyltransferase [Omnitrophica WOR_2 bacterium RIFCSPHIGHO2_02_FULL_48_11]OGX33259.1 MAG: glucose-1-phosphate adenylyltransferase [Omnitrophica WOR_2 bacterium RIFCSPHIGHO2_01_FULL_48_9]
MRDVLTFVLAGGKGERLDPLTRDRAKPAVPFGGIYRIIDFTLSNCINSGLRKVYVLIQYKSFSLQKHILAGWDVVSSQLGEFIDVIPAQQRIGADWYKGTADAIYQNIYAIQDLNPRMVLILAGDHIYKMNYRKMIDYHKAMNADMTVACVLMPKETSSQFGVVEVDAKQRVCGFQEKPDSPKTPPGNPKQIFASMGIYLFNKDVLCEELDLDAKAEPSDHDFGKNVIPQMLKRKRKIYVHNFIDDNNQPLYWRDIGTRDAYYQANMDLVSAKPAFDLYDKSWPVRTYHAQYPPIKLISEATSSGAARGLVLDSIIAGGCVITGGHIERSILSPSVRIYKEAHIANSILMEGVVVGEHSKIKNAIIDKEVNIPPHSTIGYDLELDKKRFAVTTSGVVIVPKKTAIPE